MSAEPGPIDPHKIASEMETHLHETQRFVEAMLAVIDTRESADRDVLHALFDEWGVAQIKLEKLNKQLWAATGGSLD